MNDKAERVAGSALILGELAFIALLPLWGPIAVVWLLATRRSLRSCGHESNRMSGIEDNSEAGGAVVSLLGDDRDDRIMMNMH